jgi:nucleotide-binding universal stress UspA family protein
MNHRHASVTVITACLALLSGCGQRAVVYGPPSQPVSLMSSPGVELRGGSGEHLSLFKSDQEVIGNQELEKILSLKLSTPAGARLAVLALGTDQRQWFWSPEVAKAEERTTGALLEALSASTRLGAVHPVPSLLVPGSPSIPRLREAAARIQADLLLVYAPRFRTYEKYRLFSRDQTKAYCTVEAIVLDVRSGIARMSCVASEDYELKRGSDDLNFAETVRKAEYEVLQRALLRIANDVVTFLASAP